MTEGTMVRRRLKIFSRKFWRRWFSFTLGFKILVPTMLAFILTAVALVGFYSWQMSRQAYEDLESRLETFASGKAAELTEPLWNFRDDMVLKLMHSYSHNDDLLSASLVDGDGKLLAQVHGRLSDGYTQTRRTTRELTHISGSQVYKLGRLEVVYHDARVAKFLELRTMDNAAVIVLVLLVLALSLWLSMHFIVGRPLWRLKQSMAANLGNKEMEPLKWTSQDELGEVVRAYNSLLKEVESQKKRFKNMNKALRKEVEQRLRAEKELQLAAGVFNVSIEGIAITDEQGDIRNVNKSFEAITGFSAAEVTGRNLCDVKAGMGDAGVYTAIWDHVNTIGHWSGEIWNQRKNGERYAERLTIFRMAGDDGDSHYQVAVFHEITERKLAEQALKRSRDEFELQVELRTAELRQLNENLIEMDRLRSSFLSSASHELRTPLTSILGFVKLVKRDFRRGLAEGKAAASMGQAPPDNFETFRRDRILQNLRIIEQEGDRLTRLIDDLLDLNKIESGRMQWRDEPLDLAEEIVRAVQAVSMADGTTELTFNLRIQKELPLAVMDRDRFQQVMINLLGNAIKFTPKGVVEVSLERTGDQMLRGKVKDSGMGIPPENLERIFQRFFQGDGQEKNKPKGTGLGLAICRNILEHYNGHIRAQSTPGQGSEFIFEIPIQE